MKKILTAAITLLLTSGVFSQDYKFSGNLCTMWGMYLPRTNDAGELSVGKTDLTASIELYKGNGTIFAEGSVGYDAVMKKFNCKLSEAYLDYTSSVWGIRIGAQKVVWGKADEIDITNSVFPSDSTSLFIDDDTLAVKAARISFTGSNFTIDGYWIPFFTGDKLPLEKNNPLKKVVIPETAKISISGSELLIPVYFNKINRPEFKIQNSEYGIKASAYLPLCDLSVYGFYGFDKTPLQNYKIQTFFNPITGIGFPYEILITGEHKRIVMTGFDAAFPIGSMVLRIENAFFPKRCFQATPVAILSGNTIYVRENQFKGLAGIDWMPSDWTFNLQYFYDVIANKSDNLEREYAYNHGATISIGKTFLQETLNLSLSGIIGFNYYDSAINFSAKYNITDQLKISAGSYYFFAGPDKDGTYGKFKELNTAFLKIQYDF